MCFNVTWRVIFKLSVKFYRAELLSVAFVALKTADISIQDQGSIARTWGGGLGPQSHRGGGKKSFSEKEERGRPVRTKPESGGSRRRVALEVRHCDVEKVARDARPIEAASGSSPGASGGCAAGPTLDAGSRYNVSAGKLVRARPIAWIAPSCPDAVWFCLELEIVPVLSYGSCSLSVFKYDSLCWAT